MKSCCDTYCANYGCNQGRNCPVRAQRVAKIGRKDHANQHLQPSIWRNQVRVFGKWVLILWCVLFYGAIASVLMA